MFAGVADEQVPEVRAAGRQDQLVSLELLRLSGESDVGQQLLLGWGDFAQNIPVPD